MLTKPYCDRCGSFFCPHAKPGMYARDKQAVAAWEAWLAEKEAEHATP